MSFIFLDSFVKMLFVWKNMFSLFTLVVISIPNIKELGKSSLGKYVKNRNERSHLRKMNQSIHSYSADTLWETFYLLMRNFNFSKIISVILEFPFQVLSFLYCFLFSFRRGQTSQSKQFSLNYLLYLYSFEKRFFLKHEIKKKLLKTFWRIMLKLWHFLSIYTCHRDNHVSK